MEGMSTILCVRGICARQQMRAINTKDYLTMPVVSPQGKVVVREATEKINPAQLFFCLGAKYDEAPPSTIAGKAELSNWGLGPSSITCDVTASTVHIYLRDLWHLLLTSF